jgi:hypothetical protein
MAYIPSEGTTYTFILRFGYHIITAAYLLVIYTERRWSSFRYIQYNDVCISQSV